MLNRVAKTSLQRGTAGTSTPQRMRQILPELTAFVAGYETQHETQHETRSAASNSADLGANGVRHNSKNGDGD
ncbi:MAG: hypothetical protein ABJZ55_14320 [Fuerstiella sp.]